MQLGLVDGKLPEVFMFVLRVFDAQDGIGDIDDTFE